MITNIILSIVLSNSSDLHGSFTNVNPGYIHRVQYKKNLSDPDWNDTIIFFSPIYETKVESFRQVVTNGVMFYRIVGVPWP